MTIDPEYLAYSERAIKAFEATANGDVKHRSKIDAKGRFVAGWNDCSARSQARAMGLKRYVGIPCPQGHSGERYTRSAACCECRRLEFSAWTAANRESYNEYMRDWSRARSPEQITKARRNSAASRKAWKDANREKVLAGKKKTWQKNREKWRVYVRNRRARLAGVPGTHDHNDTIAIRAKQNDRCKHCNIELHGKGEFDHITPLSRGGSNWAHNLQLLCMPCNRRKHAKDPVVHARAIGLLPPIPTAASAADDAQP